MLSEYHTKPDARQSTGAGYCTTCPLVGEECRRSKLAAKLDREAVASQGEAQG